MRKVLDSDERDNHGRRGYPPDPPTPAGPPVFALTDDVFHRRTAQPASILPTAIVPPYAASAA